MLRYNYKLALSAVAIAVSQCFLPAYGMEETTDTRQSQLQAQVSLRQMYQKLIEGIAYPEQKQSFPEKEGVVKSKYKLDSTLEGSLFIFLEHYAKLDKNTILIQGLGQSCQNALTIKDKEGKSLSDHINPMVLTLAARAKLYGGEHLKFSKNREDILCGLGLWEMDDITTYGYLADLLNTADKLKEEQEQDPTFLENYTAIHDQLELDILVHTPDSSRMNQLMGY